MIGFDVNFVGVIVGAVLAMAVGYIWFGPLFGKEWMKLKGITSEMMKKEKNSSSMGMTYGMTFVGLLVTAFVLSAFIGSLGEKTLTGGAMVAVLAWVGFVFPMAGMNALFSKTPTKLFIIDVFHYLAALLLMGAAIGYFG